MEMDEAYKKSGYVKSFYQLRPEANVGGLIVHGLLMIGIIYFVWLCFDSTHYQQKFWLSGDEAYRHGDYAAALDDYEQYEKLFPENALIHHALARTFIEMGMPDKGRGELVNAIDLRTPHENSQETDRWKAELGELDKSQ